MKDEIKEEKKDEKLERKKLKTPGTGGESASINIWHQPPMVCDVSDHRAVCRDYACVFADVKPSVCAAISGTA